MKAALAAVVAVACGAPQSAPPAPAPARVVTEVPADAPPPSDDEKLAAIQKAMNELAPASQQCWAAAATERFDIDGELTLTVDIAQGRSRATLVSDTAHSEALSRCMIDLLGGWQWAPPLYGQTIQLPFKFRAPDGQSVIDRRLVAWKEQSGVSIAVLLDENNTGNEAASMLEVAIKSGTKVGVRRTTRAELWYFLGPGEVAGPGKPLAHTEHRAVQAGDMMYVPGPDGLRYIEASAGDLHAVVVLVPGGREGTARAGALPDLEASGRLKGPVLLPASGAKTYGPATIYLEDSIVKGTPLAASILQLPAGANVAEHVHAKETEMLYILEGSGTVTIAGTDVAVTPTSVIQIPANTKHAFAAKDAVRALQIYTPAGPEQRFKKKP